MSCVHFMVLFTVMVNAVRVVAGNLKRLRTERGVSLSELARMSGVAKGTLSGLEAGRGNPTVGTLWSVADALGVPFGELVWEPERRPVEVLRAGEGARAGEAGEEVRLLGALPEVARLELYEMRLAPGVRREAAAHAQGVTEYVFVTGGVMLAGPNDEPTELVAGDSLRFLGDRPHLYAAAGGEEALALVVLGYPALRHSGGIRAGAVAGVVLADPDHARGGTGKDRPGLLGDEDLALIRATVERALADLAGRGEG